jgi:hypothetical protein
MDILLGCIPYLFDSKSYLYIWAYNPVWRFGVMTISEVRLFAGKAGNVELPIPSLRFISLPAVRPSGYYPKIPSTVGPALGKRDLVIDLSGIPHLKPHLPAGFVSLIPFFNLFGLAVIFSVFLLVIPLLGVFGFGSAFAPRLNHNKHLLNL